MLVYVTEPRHLQSDQGVDAENDGDDPGPGEHGDLYPCGDNQLYEPRVAAGNILVCMVSPSLGGGVRGYLCCQ
jgi:hypothetical protein